MTPSWLCAILATSLAYAYLWRRDRSAIFWSQTVCVVLMLAKLGAFYAPWVSENVYDWLAWSADLITTACDCLVITAVLRSTRCLQDATGIEVATVFLLAVHQHIRLQFAWATDLFQLPSGMDAVLIPIRASSNYAYLLCICILVEARMRDRRHNDRRMQAEAEAHTQAS